MDGFLAIYGYPFLRFTRGIYAKISKYKTDKKFKHLEYFPDFLAKCLVHDPIKVGCMLKTKVKFA
jgi:hypothetical protein